VGVAFLLGGEEMEFLKKERRKYERYDMKAKVHFRIYYELTTKVKFCLFGEHKGKVRAKEFTGITRNISVEGLCFYSPKKLKKNDTIFIKIYLPESRKPIPMIGQVQWSKKTPAHAKGKFKFNTGVKLLSVRGHSVVRSIHIDRKYKESWSIVLDSVLGGFRRSLHKAMVRAKTISPAVILKKPL
jgi:hypothetical protein